MKNVNGAMAGSLTFAIVCACGTIVLWLYGLRLRRYGCVACPNLKEAG